EAALEDVRRAQARLVHAERMAALGLLVAGISHEINNALNFIYGNLPTLERYTRTLQGLAEAYRARLPDGGRPILGDADAELIAAHEGLPPLGAEIAVGARRAKEIVGELRRFVVGAGG